MLTTVEALQPDDELGIDARLARELSCLILSDDIIVTRKNQPEGYRSWNREGLLEYGAWLCLLLDLKPEGSEAIGVRHIARASKLGLGPSGIVFDLIGGIGVLQAELGFRSRKDFSDWTRSYYIEQGQALAKHLKGRPTGKEIQKANAERKFPSARQIKKRFGTLQNFYEIIGYPNFVGAVEEDYLDWGVAFKRQNGIDTRITFDVLCILSKRGRSPSTTKISSEFGIPQFNKLAEKEYLLRLAEEDQGQRLRLEQAKRLSEEDETLSYILRDTEQQDILRITAQYRLARAVVPTMRSAEVIELSIRQKADSVAESLVKMNPTIHMGHIENAAVELGVFDDLWPMYRFQNVDLQVAA